MLQHGQTSKHDANWQKPDTKDCTFSDPIYIKCPEKANLQRQKVDQWMPGGSGKRRDLKQKQGNFWGY